MKVIVFTVCWLLVSVLAYAQNAFYDAQLSNSLSASEVTAFADDAAYALTQAEKDILKDFASFLKKPFDPQTPSPDFGRVRAILRKIKASTELPGNTEALVGTQIASLLIPFSNLSKLSTAQLDTALYGLTVYFADEFRRGYMEAYLRGFERSIGEVGELQVMFPATYQKMRSFDPARFKELGSELKAVFDQDLSSSLDHLMAHIDAAGTPAFPNHKLVFLRADVCKEIKGSSVYPYLQISSEVGQKLIRGEHPSDIMGFLDSKYYTPPASNTLTNTALTVALTGTATVGLSESAVITAVNMLTISSMQAATLTTSDMLTLAVLAGGSVEVIGNPITADAIAQTLTMDSSATVVIQGMVSLTGTPGKAYTIVAPASVTLLVAGSVTALSASTFQVNSSTAPAANSFTVLLSGTATGSFTRPTALATNLLNNRTTRLMSGKGSASLQGSTTLVTRDTLILIPTPVETKPTSLSGLDLTRQNFGNAIHFYNLIQRNLRDTTGTRDKNSPSVWIDFEKLEHLKTSSARAYFMALIYKEDTTFFNHQSLVNGLNFKKLASSNITIDDRHQITCPDCLNAFESFRTKQAGDLLGKLTKIDEFVRLKKDHLTDETNFVPFMKLTKELLHTVFSLAESSTATIGTLQTVFSISEEVFNGIQAVRVKNYSNVLLHTTNVLNTLYETKSNVINDTLAKRFLKNLNGLVLDPKKTPYLRLKNNADFDPLTAYNQLAKAVASPVERALLNRSTDFRAKLIGQLKTNGTDLDSLTAGISGLTLTASSSYSVVFAKLTRTFDQWSGFTSGVVSATNSEDIRKVISRYAAPPASFIEKRTSPFTISVSGMPGLFVGVEKADLSSATQSFTATDEAKSKKPFTVGLSLPVGLDFAWAFNSAIRRQEKKGAYSIGLFVQLIDLGAMLNYRLTTQSNTLPEEVKIKDIFSPGGMINIGFPNTPFTLGAGYQYAPALRRLDKKDRTLPLLNAHRWQLRLAYDIPLFRIYSNQNYR